MAAPPPRFTLPPPQNKKQQGQQNAYRSYINAHPSLRPWAQLIYNSAADYGLDPLYFAALINFESGGRKNARSSANAFGLAQIHIPSWVGHRDPRDGHIISQRDVQNPTWNVRFGAYLFSRAYRKYGSYDAAYRQGYNPDYSGAGPFTGIPKGYVPTTRAKSPEEAAQRSVETGQAKASLLERQSARQVLDPIYLAYTGKPATEQQVSQWIKRPISSYQLELRLANPDKNPRFFKSPVWLTSSPGYEAAYKDIFGPDAKIDPQARKWIAYAIVHNLGATGFQQFLRDKPQYENSQEYKGLFAKYQSVYASIYGTPTEGANAVIKKATKAGWTQEQWTSFLRKQPEWTSSGEYKSLALDRKSVV